ncbi:hypothetical protein KGY71_05495, partial [Candidatus Bipolaricaulota bacterium]|nr:hypothetical protein [Candidatus Bipolaricaulota bacterium]
NESDNKVNAVLNSWDGKPEVEGGDVVYSPWIEGFPDAAQLKVVVDDVGVKPEGGFLGKAVSQANSTPEKDTIKVNHGTYALNNTISSPVTMESEKGSADHTFIEDDLVIDSSNVYVGSRMKGFTVVGDVTVTSGSNTELHWNQINGKLINESGSTVDAVLNSWDGQPEVEGQNVVYSPWIVGSPDDEELLIIVDETKGAKPQDGYLDTALGATNGSEEQDEIVVNHGEYEASKSIEAPVDLHSEHGSAADTHVHESLTLESADILIGHKGEGFTIHDDVTVASGVDASTIHINWNNIYGTVTNNGSGTLDATYNYWGDEDPSDDTVGKVNYDPYLPTTVGEFRTYMEANGFTDPDKALNEFGDETDTVGLSSESMSTSDLAVMRLREAGFDGTEANQIVSDFGADVVLESYRDSGGYNEFVERLMGYEVEPAGEEGTVLDSPVSLTAAGNGKSVDAEYEVGEQIEVGFSLKDYQGKEVRSELATVTVARVKDDEANIIKATPATYDEEEGAYRVTTSTEELGSGTYQLYIDLKEGSTTRKTVQVVG